MGRRGAVARITRGADIRRVFAGGRRVSRGPLAVIGLAAARTSPTPRVGIIAGRKFGGAVQRNRFKRRVRVMLRLHVDAIPPGWDLLVLPRSSDRPWSFNALSDAFQALMTSWAREAPSA